MDLIPVREKQQDQSWKGPGFNGIVKKLLEEKGVGSKWANKLGIQFPCSRELSREPKIKFETFFFLLTFPFKPLAHDL
jgi:hypothetical protein